MMNTTDPIRSQTFDVTEGLHCASCVARMTKAVRALPSVTDCTVDLVGRRLHVDVAQGGPDANRMISAMAAAGFTIHPILPDNPTASDSRSRSPDSPGRTALLAGVLGLPAAVLGMGHLGGSWGVWVQAISALVVVAWPGRTIVRNAVLGLWRRRFDMDVLVGLGVLASIGLSLALWAQGRHELWFDSATMVLAVVLLGRWIEDRARTGVTQAVRLLGARRPAVALLADGREVPLSEIHAGDRLRLRQGDLIPVDGTIVAGGIRIDESLLTGELAPVRRDIGAPVVGGTLVIEGSAECTATAVGGQAWLGRLEDQVRQAQAAKPPIARLADAISARFVPAALLIAVVTAIAWILLDREGGLVHGLIAAATVLVVSCPCALGLATPTAIAVAVGRAASAGILIRDGAALETAARIDTVVLDKTGTLTVGRPTVVAALFAPATEREAILRLAAAAESACVHPLARAVITAAASSAPAGAGPVASQVAISAGRGISAEVEGRRVLVGNAAHLAEHGVALDPTLDDRSAMGATPVLIAIDGIHRASLAVDDALRPDAVALIARLRSQGIRILLASGDARGVVAAVAARLDISEIHAGVDPAAKLALIQDLRRQGRRVAMVGDGLNDAAAFAAADLGLAVAGGADALSAIGHAVVQRPLAVADTLDLGRRTVATIHVNLWWAFGYNLIAIPIAAGVLWPLTGRLLDPMLAAAAMGASSLLVVGNSLRLRRWQPALP